VLLGARLDLVDAPDEGERLVRQRRGGLRLGDVMEAPAGMRLM
jgi:hypothetical protein